MRASISERREEGPADYPFAVQLISRKGGDKHEEADDTRLHRSSEWPV
jgi:hypothetical protein